jgi:hypothetical protein
MEFWHAEHSPRGHSWRVPNAKREEITEIVGKHGLEGARRLLEGRRDDARRRTPRAVAPASL